MTDAPLLGPDDPAPVMRVNPTGAFPWLLVADHAGAAVPKRLDNLGLSAKRMVEHIAIDIGIWDLTGMIAAALDAEAVGQAYSRLLVDCNRRPGTPASMPEISDGWIVPANLTLHGDDSRARIAEVFEPYHAAVADGLTRHPALCAMHSFTRTLGRARRTVDIGVIHGPDAALADRLLAALAGQGALTVGRNEPYQIDFAGDHTLPVHAEARGIPYVEIEVCQDLIGTPAGRARVAEILIPAFRAAARIA